MAPPRTFDYDRLKLAVREHPEWSYAQYADLLTTDNRQKDPLAPRVKPSAVGRVISLYWDAWKEDGITPSRRRLTGQDIRVPLARVSENYWMDTSVRYLREIWNARQQKPALTEHQRIARRSALKWEAGLRETRHIVDITADGRPIVRSARADELDADGNLLEITAWAIPGREVPYQTRNGRSM